MNILKDVNFFQGFVISLAVLICILYTVSSTPQQPEINDKFENFTQIEAIVTPNDRNEQIEVEPNTTAHSPITAHSQITAHNPAIIYAEVAPNEESFIRKVYRAITTPIVRIISIPKVKFVLHNIGTCVVNGAMELITYYLPPPLIPLIASAAGTIIPFEPVVLLREKMPVTSYRRAFKTALDGFLGTFDRYKLEDEEDPYMTRRFNRRLMDHSNEKNKIGN
ncbi:hypothetical protein evm_005425 [Chilo suppressalis]|nr:hypothetical protein evm_005425 [Chilo suppressalis]